ncbi:insulin-like peptide receptor isoform X2 [Eurosta solidaginis]
MLLLRTTQFATVAAAGTNARVGPLSNKMPGECRSIDIRNNCENIFQLTNCTIIRGFLLFVLRPVHVAECDYTNVTFPLLREITDFLIMHDVRGLRSMRDIFPNLTVIRGRRLFLNYALGISHMLDLETVEFKSLIAIQHGHVYISSPKLCNLGKINWDRITLSVGENHIFPPSPEDCPNDVICQGCTTEYCWTNETCQHFENENLIAPSSGIQHCHEECLGGCHNSSSNGCLLCKHLTDHGACVKECPEGKYLIETYQNCTTASECTTLGMTVKGNSCTLECPAGQIVAFNEREILACVPCDTPLPNHILFINTLSDANRIRGCKSLNASIIISLRNEVHEDDLTAMLKELREIRGSLKVFRSTGLKSLKFLSGIQKIALDPHYLDADVYGLVLHDNENLEELWYPEKLELVHGSMYIHLNKKLCNRKLRQFTRSIVHDRSKDTIQVNDQEVLCDPSKLLMTVEVLSHRSARFSWPREHISAEIEVLYRPVNFDEDFTEHSELDADICHRILWTRILLSPKDLTGNDSNYSYTVNDMKPYTRYACLVKTFGADDSKDARSELTYIETLLDLPAPPKINVNKKTDVSITIQLSNATTDIVRYYTLELYELNDDLTILDRRDFCIQQNYVYHMGDYLNNEDDQDSCCARKEEKKDDDYFKKNMHELYKCNADHRSNCIPGGANETATPYKALRRIHINAHDNNQTILRHLSRYRLYAIQVQSCNAAGCGAYSFYALRTAAAMNSERLDDLRGCRVADTNEFHVDFSEPKEPNGPIVSYVVHFRERIPTDVKFRTHIECMTRLQHQYNNYHFIGQLKAPFNEVAVRVNTLAGSCLTHWLPIQICPADKDAGDIAIMLSEQTPHMSSRTVVILVGLLATIFGIVVWSCYKTDCWRNNFWRRYLVPLAGWQPLRREEAQQLVEFRNITEEDLLSSSAS